MKTSIPDVAAGDRPSASWMNRVKEAGCHEHVGMAQSSEGSNTLPTFVHQACELYELTGAPELDATVKEYKATAKPCVPRICAVDGDGHATGTAAPGDGQVRYYMDPDLLNETIWFPSGARNTDKEPDAAPSETTGDRVWTTLHYDHRVVLRGGGSAGLTWYQLLTDMDGADWPDGFQAEANPGTLDGGTGGLTDDNDGEVTEGTTVIVVDTSKQIPAWKGDWIQCKPLSVSEEFEAVEEFEDDCGRNFVEVVARASSQLEFGGALLAAFLAAGGTEQARLTMNDPAGTTKYVADEMLQGSQILPPYAKIKASYRINLRKFVVSGAACMPSGS
jgi:hypothetical protein